MRSDSRPEQLGDPTRSPTCSRGSATPTSGSEVRMSSARWIWRLSRPYSTRSPTHPVAESGLGSGDVGEQAVRLEVSGRFSGDGVIEDLELVCDVAARDRRPSRCGGDERCVELMDRPFGPGRPDGRPGRVVARGPTQGSSPLAGSAPCRTLLCDGAIVASVAGAWYVISCTSSMTSPSPVVVSSLGRGLVSPGWVGLERDERAGTLIRVDSLDIRSVLAVVEAEQERTVRQIASLEAVVAAIVEGSELTSTDDEHDPEGATIAYERAQASALLRQARADLRRTRDHAPTAGRGSTRDLFGVRSRHRPRARCGPSDHDALCRVRRLTPVSGAPGSGGGAHGCLGPRRGPRA